MRHGLGSFAAGAAMGFVIGRATRKARALPAWIDPPIARDGDVLEECSGCEDGFHYREDGTMTLCDRCGGKLYVPHSHG